MMKVLKRNIMLFSLNNNKGKSIFAACTKRLRVIKTYFDPFSMKGWYPLYFDLEEGVWTRLFHLFGIIDKHLEPDIDRVSCAQILVYLKFDLLAITYLLHFGMYIIPKPHIM